MNDIQLERLLAGLLRLPSEREWVGKTSRAS
jgi:hypothetical protein